LPAEWAAPGGIAHYDTAYVHRFGLSSYDEDPICELFREVGRLVIISLSPSVATLKAQFDRRTRHQRGGKKGSHLLWRDYVRRPVERTFRRLKGIDVREAREFYGEPGWLKRCYDEWNAFAQRLVNDKPASHIMRLVPAPDASGKPSFRLLP
jgi:hypothetical protein